MLKELEAVHLFSAGKKMEEEIVSRMTGKMAEFGQEFGQKKVSIARSLPNRRKNVANRATKSTSKRRPIKNPAIQ